MDPVRSSWEAIASTGQYEWSKSGSGLGSSDQCARQYDPRNAVLRHARAAWIRLVIISSLSHESAVDARSIWRSLSPMQSPFIRVSGTGIAHSPAGRKEHGTASNSQGWRQNSESAQSGGGNGRAGWSRGWSSDKKAFVSAAEASKSTCRDFSNNDLHNKPLITYM